MDRVGSKGTDGQMEEMALSGRWDTFFIEKGGKISWRRRRFPNLVAGSFSSFLITNRPVTVS